MGIVSAWSGAPDIGAVRAVFIFPHVAQLRLPINYRLPWASFYWENSKGTKARVESFTA
jgi:hypothetical protein